LVILVGCKDASASLVTWQADQPVVTVGVRYSSLRCGPSVAQTSSVGLARSSAWRPDRPILVDLELLHAIIAQVTARQVRL
jgi:hypothetical protein